MSHIATLELHQQTRPGVIYPGGARKTERTFIDFVVNGMSLAKLSEKEGFDHVSCLVLPHPDPLDVKRLLLQEAPDCPDGRSSLYVCSECGHISCGAVTVRIEADATGITWHDFAYQNNYDESMTYDLDRFNALGVLRFEAEAYRALLQPFSGQ